MGVIDKYNQEIWFNYRADKMPCYNCASPEMLRQRWKKKKNAERGGGGGGGGHIFFRLRFFPNFF